LNLSQDFAAFRDIHAGQSVPRRPSGCIPEHTPKQQSLPQSKSFTPPPGGHSITEAAKKATKKATKKNMAPWISLGSSFNRPGIDDFGGPV